MSEFLPPIPPETILAWVHEVDGEVVGMGCCPVGDYDTQPVPEGRIRHPILQSDYEALVTAPRAWCVVEGALVARTESSITLSTDAIEADGVDEAVVTDIPEGAAMRIWGAVKVPWTTITGGTVTVTCSVAGKIHMEVRCAPPHKDWVGTINAA